MLLSRLNSFARNTRGNIALITALAALPLFGAVGVAVDVFRKGEAQSRLQAALDAGALAGASSSTTNQAQIRKQIRQFVMSNGGDQLLNNANMIDITFASNGRIIVSAEGTIGTTVTGVFGMSEMKIMAASEVKASNGGAEVSLVLDTTDSMNSEGRIEALRTAASEFVKVIGEANGPSGDRIKVSLVPYAHYVNVGTGQAGASWLDNTALGANQVWHGCVGPREYPANTRDSGYNNTIPRIIDDLTVSDSYTDTPCAPEIVPLTADQSVLNSRLTALTATGTTYIPAGLMWGWRTLSDTAPYTEGEGPTMTAAKNIKKFIVLMTDGLNTMEKVSGTPYLQHNNFITEASDNLTLEICSNVKDAGIEVYTIGFKLIEPEMKAKLEQCASTPENYYDAADDNQLSAAYRAIGQHISAVHLSK